jgi:hypothetical protein
MLVAMRDYVEGLAAIVDDGRRHTPEGWTLTDVLDHLVVMEEAVVFRTGQFFRPNETAAVISPGLRSYAPAPVSALAHRFGLLRGRILSRLRRATAADRKRSIKRRIGGAMTFAEHLRGMVQHDQEYRRQLEGLLRR